MPKPFHNPFAVLSHLRGNVADALPPPTAEAAATPAARTIPRAVVRLERSGRGGKDVTLVEHLALDAAGLEAWIKTLKSALGCGGRIEGAALVLQGDQRKRLPAMLTARGVKKVTVG